MKVIATPDVAKLRKLVVNMIYVGVASDLIGIDPSEIERAVRKQLKGKAKTIDLNLAAVRLGIATTTRRTATVPFTRSTGAMPAERS